MGQHHKDRDRSIQLIGGSQAECHLFWERHSLWPNAHEKCIKKQIVDGEDQSSTLFRSLKSPIHGIWFSCSYPLKTFSIRRHSWLNTRKISRTALREQRKGSSSVWCLRRGVWKDDKLRKGYTDSTLMAVDDTLVWIRIVHLSGLVHSHNFWSNLHPNT